MSKNKLNNILNNFEINDNLNEDIIKSTRISDNYSNVIDDFSTNNYILNNSLIISKYSDDINSYNLYYKDNNSYLYLMSYIIKEGNGLYNYDTYNSLFFNIDDYSIKEAYNRIYVDTNFITISNDDVDKFGISNIDLSYLNKENNTITINNEFILNFLKTRNRLDELKQKCEDIYNKIEYYDTLIKSYHNQIDKKIIYYYSDINIKYKDDYYFNEILNPAYINHYVTLDSNLNGIYYKNLDSLDIKISIDSNYAYNIMKDQDNFAYHIFENNSPDIEYIYNNIYQNDNNQIYASLSKKNTTYFQPLLSSLNRKYSEKNDNKYYSDGIYTINTHTNITYNGVFMENNSILSRENFKKHGGQLEINIEPDTISYIDKKYINKYSLLYDIKNIAYNVSFSYIDYNYITKYIPNINKVKVIYDNRDIKYGKSFYNENIKNLYLAFFDEYFGDNISIDLTNILINKLIDHNIIWYNYDEVLHYGYNISYINDKSKYFNKKYIPIWQNISTKVINYNFFKNYSPHPNNLNIIDIDNTIAMDMSKYVYDIGHTNRNIYLYKFDFKNNQNNVQIIYINKFSI